jgi:N-acetyl-gamma-glutamyl-phosphate reductase
MSQMHMPSQPLNAMIVGAPGYAGRELIHLLLEHPSVRIGALFGSDRQSAEKPARIADLHPSLFGRLDLPVHPVSVAAIADARPDIVFLATPHEASLELAPEILKRSDASCKPVVLDLSAAFRFTSTRETTTPPAHLYPKHYGFEHTHPELLRAAVYGLPELNREAIRTANLIAVPGCYPTSAIIPLAPLARAGAIDRARPVIIDSVSGVSGAGRTPTSKTHFSEVSLQAYNVLKHRHNPEIDLHAGVTSIFTPHLVEFDRGILSTIHVDLAPGWNEGRVAETLAAAYGGTPFVRLLGRDRWPGVAGVRGTNFCDIGWIVQESTRHLIVSSAIDNLVKGAAGQAVQCMNIRFGLAEGAGLAGSTR